MSVLLLGTKDFNKNIQRYNKMFTITSYKANSDDLGSYLTTYKVQASPPNDVVDSINSRLMAK